MVPHFVNRCSLIGNEFCKAIYDAIQYDFKKIYFGDHEYRFYPWLYDVKIAVVDFYIKDINLIIEFYGDYWHRNPALHSDESSVAIRKKDEIRINAIKEKFGSDVLIVWENDYNTDKDMIIESVIKYIKTKPVINFY